MENCGIILLAAGASTRLGQAKQLLAYKQTNLFCHSLQAATESNATNIVVVQGSLTLEAEQAHPNVHFIHNNNWREGIGTSVSAGLSALLQIAPDTENVILMVCDQPFISAHLLNDLIHKKQVSPKGIIACAYRGTIGTPALFRKKYFEELLQLTCDEGANKLVKKYPEDVERMLFNFGYIDIDTMQDYRALVRAVA